MLEKTDNGVKLSHFTLEISLRGSNPAPGKLWTSFDWGETRIVSDYIPKPFRAENERLNIVILGNPVFNDKIDPEKVAKKVMSQWDDNDVFREIDSEFLIFVADKQEKTLNIATSRFSSPPAFVHLSNERFIASFSFWDIWKRLTETGSRCIDNQSVYELLAYKRVFAHRTHDVHTQLLAPASVLRFDGRSIKSDKYWRPDFSRKTNASIEDSAKEFGALLKRAIQRKTSDGKRPALFLSGGMDTRTLLATFKSIGEPPLCVTVNQFKNREAVVAKALANEVGAEHIFIPFKEHHYRDLMPQALAVTGGLQLPFCMFLGYKNILEGKADIILHGHGFDYMFQGMYLPRRNWKLFGRQLHYSKMTPPTDPIDDFFLKNVSYGIINHNPRFSWIIRKEHADELNQGTKDDVSGIGTNAKEICSNPYDALEFRTFYNLARHYPFGDHWGMNTNLPQRTLSFDNDLYAFYQSLPPGHRFDGRIFKRYLMDVNPKMGRMISANHQFPVCASNLERTFLQIQHAIMRRLSPKRHAKENAKEDFERMGTPTNHLFASELKHLVDSVANSERLASIPFIDMDGVKRYVDWFENNFERDNGQLMMALSTIHQLLDA
jgi:hypothetical protein